MEDTICPRCKTTKFQNPSLKMMVNICGHALCESCVDLLFLKGSGACPECRIPLRRNNFRIQLFEDPAVEKEVDIRKRVLRDFNKKEEDFSSLAEYNDYLEEIETIIYNLMNDIDIIETNKKIEMYKKENRELIMKNKTKLGREEYELEEIIELEKQQEELRRNFIKMEEVSSKKKKITQKEALIDELMFSNANASNIVEHFAQSKQQEVEVMPDMKMPEKLSHFSTGVKFGASINSSFLPVKIDEGPLFIYKPVSLLIDGPRPPVTKEIINGGFVNHIRQETNSERAGGFKAHIACQRALQDAFAGLFHVKRSPTAE